MRANRPSLLTALLLSMLAAAPAIGQDFTQLKLKPGDTVYVTVPSAGSTVQGAMTGVTATTITVDGREFSSEPGLRIARRGDRLLNGFLIGFGAGALLSATAVFDECEDSAWSCAAGSGIGFGLIGLLIDAVHKGRTVVYEAPAASKPSARLFASVTSRTRAVNITLSF